MKKYYIIRQDGSSLFRLPYEEEFIFHCLIKLLDTSDEKFRLLSFADTLDFSAVQADRGTGDKSPVFAKKDLLEQKNIFTYILK